MTTQDFFDLYEKSVYQVRLEIASRLWCEGTERIADCLAQADIFVNALLKEDFKQLRRSHD